MITVSFRDGRECEYPGADYAEKCVLAGESGAAGPHLRLRATVEGRDEDRTVELLLLSSIERWIDADGKEHRSDGDDPR